MVFFSTGSGIQHLLDQSMIRSIVSSMKSDLQKQDYDAAMEFAVLQVRDVLDGNGPQRYGLYGMIIILSVSLVIMSNGLSFYFYSMLFLSLLVLCNAYTIII